MFVASHTIGGTVGVLSRQSVMASLEVTGPYDVEACREMLIYLSPHLITPPAVAVLMYDQAIITSSLHDIAMAVDEFDPSRTMSKTPAALIVAPGLLESALEHCRCMRAHGYSRAAFVDRESANRWAAERVAIIESFAAQK
jgi:hypothetical protein